MTIEGRDYLCFGLIDMGNARTLVPGTRVTLGERQTPPSIVFMDIISDDVVKVTRQLHSYPEPVDIRFYEKTEINRRRLGTGNELWGVSFRWYPGSTS